MKSAFRSAIPTTLAFSLRSSNPTMHRHRHRHPLTLLPLYAARCSPTPFPLTSMAGGESGTHAPPAPTVQSLEKHLRDCNRSVSLEIESATRLMHSSLLLKVLETAKGQIGLLRELFSKLAEITRECPGQYYRYHGDWRSETQTVVSLLAFMHWLETGSLLRHTEAEEKLGSNPYEFGLDVEDYLVSVCGEPSPRKILKFLTDLHAAFRMLNLWNDFLCKRVEEVYYYVKIRGLAANGDKTGEQRDQEQS
ncbi:hypothetical protein Pfo_029817 [Paulownia fortunei]|nr:hypothetical protein Pfo_029817 [Paulownia fortunei]